MAAGLRCYRSPRSLLRVDRPRCARRSATTPERRSGVWDDHPRCRLRQVWAQLNRDHPRRTRWAGMPAATSATSLAAGVALSAPSSTWGWAGNGPCAPRGGRAADRPSDLARSSAPRAHPRGRDLTYVRPTAAGSTSAFVVDVFSRSSRGRGSRSLRRPGLDELEMALWRLRAVGACAGVGWTPDSPLGRGFHTRLLSCVEAPDVCDKAAGCRPHRPRSGTRPALGVY